MRDKKYFSKEIDEEARTQIVKSLIECRDLLTKEIKRDNLEHLSCASYNITLSEVKYALKLLGIT